MADALVFYRNLSSTINQFISLLQQLETLKDRMDSDPQVSGAAASAAAAAGRSDLSAQDFANAGDAITQVLFAFNSGAPTQKSFLYKIL